MAGFLYYLPGVGRTTLADLKKAGLGHAFDSAVSQRPTDKGPDDGPGVVAVSGDRLDLQRHGCFPDKQTWQRVVGSVAYVGMYTDGPPGPDDVALVNQLPGYDVKLGDGNEWVIPIARGTQITEDDIVPVCSLPTVSKWDYEAGEWATGGVIPEYAALWKLANATAEAVYGAEMTEEGAECTVQDAHQGAVTTIAANYRIGIAEADMLGLLNTQTVGAVLRALVDYDAWETYLKKKQESALLDSEPGRQDDSPDTVPP